MRSFRLHELSEAFYGFHIELLIVHGAPVGDVVSRLASPVVVVEPLEYFRGSSPIRSISRLAYYQVPIQVSLYPCLLKGIHVVPPTGTDDYFRSGSFEQFSKPLCQIGVE